MGTIEAKPPQHVLSAIGITWVCDWTTEETQLDPEIASIHKKEAILRDLQKGFEIVVEDGGVRRTHVLGIDPTVAVDNEGNG